MIIFEPHNGLDEDCPDNFLSIFSFVSILLGVSTACLRSCMGNNIQYNFFGKCVFKYL